MALWRNFIEENIFLMESYPIVADSSLAKAMSVSLLVGQTGFPNLTQKSKNCLRLLLWLRLVPSAYILAKESFAFESKASNSLSTGRGLQEGVLGGLGGGEDGGKTWLCLHDLLGGEEGVCCMNMRGAPLHPSTLCLGVGLCIGKMVR